MAGSAHHALPGPFSQHHKSLATHTCQCRQNPLANEFPEHGRYGPCRGVVIQKCPFHRIRVELVERLVNVEASGEDLMAPLLVIADNTPQASVMSMGWWSAWNPNCCATTGRQLLWTAVHRSLSYCW